MVVPNEDNVLIEKFKGLDCTSHPSLIDNQAFSILRNVEFGDQGEMARRRGLYIRTDLRNRASWVSGKQVAYLGGFFTDNTQLYHIFTVAGMPYVGTSLVYDQPQPVAGIPAGFLCVGVVQYNSIWYFLSSNNGIYKVATPSATPTATSVSGSPNCAAFLSFKDRLWVVQTNSVNGSTVSSTIQYSAPTNFDSWSGTDIVKINPGDGDVITSLNAFADRIICFKKNTIWNLYLQGGNIPVSAVRLMTRGRGAISTRSVVMVNNLLYFLASDGLWRTDGISFSDISTPIRALWSHGPVSFGFDQNDWLAYFNNTLHIKLTRAPGYPDNPNMQVQGGYYYITMDLNSGAWSEQVFPSFSAIGELTRPVPARNYDGTITFMQGANDRIWARSEEYYVDDVGGDHAYGQPVFQAIPITLKSKRFSVDRKTRVKRLKYAMIGMEGVVSAPRYYYTVDGEDRDIYDFDPTSVNQYGAYKIYGCGYFRTFELNFSDIGTDRFRLDFLNFIVHLKRQLAESPR